MLTIRPLPGSTRPLVLALLAGALLFLVATLYFQPSTGNLPARSPGPAVAYSAGQLPLAFVPGPAGAGSPSLQARGGALSLSREGLTLRLASDGEPGEGEPLLLRFLGANPMVEVAGVSPLPGTVNRYTGATTALWQVGLPSYGAALYRELYPGIDLLYEGTEGVVKGTFHVAPGARPSRIRWSYGNAEQVRVYAATGDLHVTVAGQHRLVERAPVAWQHEGGQRVEVPVRFEMGADGRVGFLLPEGYDPTRPLTIDPILVYERNFPGGDGGRKIVVAADGSAYILARALNGNDNDVLVLKLSPAGEVGFATYLRGSEVDVTGGIALDDTGNLYISGRTSSDDFPILNAMQPVMNGPSDAFIARLSGSDGSLLFSTYFGGSRHEEANDIVVDSAGDLLLVGATDSTDFPTVDPFQGALNLEQCFCYDAFVSRLSPDGMQLHYSSYFGGARQDYGVAIALDGAENILIAGHTESDNLPLASPVQASYGGARDGFATKLAPDGGTLLYSTYLGGGDLELLAGIAIDAGDNAHVVGATRSPDYPTTPGAFQEHFVGGILACGVPGFDLHNCEDIFLTRLSPTGAFVYSTFIGGTDEEMGRGVAIDAASNALVDGYTYSEDFPLVSGTTVADILLTRINPAGDDLAYTFTIPSQVPNNVGGVTVDGEGAIYLTGAQVIPHDLYVAKISETPATVRSAAILLRDRPLGGHYLVSGLVIVRDQGGEAVVGATVGVAWTLPDGTTRRQSATSGPRGRASFRTLDGSGAYTLTVEEIAAEGYLFDPEGSVLSRTILVP